MDDTKEIKGVKQRQLCTFITELIRKTENSNLQKGMPPSFPHQPEGHHYHHNHKYFSHKMW